MLSKLKKIRDQKSSDKGFTIIEVMIVLAIAGLIILIVFLAVPALQRNSRNTQRKSDIGRIASAAQTVIDNNNGALTGLTSTSLQAELDKLGYYATTAVTVAAAPTTATNGTTVDTVIVYTGSTCGSVSNGLGAVAGTSRQLAVVYSTEGGSGAVPACTAE